MRKLESRIPGPLLQKLLGASGNGTAEVLSSDNCIPGPRNRQNARAMLHVHSQGNMYMGYV